MAEAFPLHWPTGYPRTPRNRRKRAPFQVPPGQAKRELVAEIQRLGGRDVVISTNTPTRCDGLPYADRRALDDPGVAVYFKRKGRDVVLACDQYQRQHDNIRAIGKTIEAMRGIERWGSSDLLDRAFTGFEALPAPEQWWQVLGVAAGAGKDAIQLAYRSKAREAHPDNGGTDAAMARLNAARDQGIREAMGG